LDIAAAGASARKPQQFLDRRSTDRRWKERARGLTRADGLANGGDRDFARDLVCNVMHR
jgi:hypothetical protein